MWLLVIPPARAPKCRINLLDTVAADPSPVFVAGERVTGFHVPDSHPDAAAVRRLRLTEFRIVEDADVGMVEAPPPAVPTQDAEQRRVRRELYVQAVGRGWSGEDLVGTWDGTRWTDAEDRSPRTGLTLLEHVQTRPPNDWAALASRGEPPWASSNWVNPDPDWEPPAFTSPLALAVVDPPVVPLVPATTDDAEGPTELFDASGIDADSETAVYALTDAELAEQAALDPWDYPSEQVERARKIIVETVGLYAQGGRLPVGRLNSALRKAGLTKLSEDAQVDWFLGLPDSTTT
jgi:hypothetical protein